MILLAEEKVISGEGFLESRLVLHLKKMWEINPLATYYVDSKVLTAGKDQIILPHLHAYSETEKKSLEYLTPE